MKSFDYQQKIIFKNRKKKKVKENEKTIFVGCCLLCLHFLISITTLPSKIKKEQFPKSIVWFSSF